MRIAVFGGSFNPPHNGHLHLVTEISRRGYADRVMLIPAFRPPHKSDRPLVAFPHRMAMTALMFAEMPEVIISDLESQRPDRPSYTFDTMLQLEKLYPEDELVLLIGADSLNTLHTWYRAAELAERWPLYAYPRPECPVEPTELGRHWRPEIAERLAAAVLPLPEMAVSSTDVRVAVRDGTSLAGLLPERVAEYIRKNRLYR